jgi:GT2 family glycosyltransferase
MHDLGVVILHHDRWPGVLATIESVIANGVDPESIVVVDNASPSDALAALRRADPRVEVIALPRNDGYAVGMNAGLRRWPDRDVLVLTHDCVLELGALAELRAPLADPTVGMAGPLLCLRSDPDVVWSAGGRYDGRRITHRGFRTPRSSLPEPTTVDVDWLDGACLVLRRDALDAVGPFDEHYFLYFEETDLAFRLRRAGYRVVCARRAVAEQEPSPRPEALFVRNQLRFLQRQVSTRAALRRAAHEMRRVARLLLSRDRAWRRRGVLVSRGVVGWLRGTDPRALYELSSGGVPRRAASARPRRP